MIDLPFSVKRRFGDVQVQASDCEVTLNAKM